MSVLMTMRISGDPSAIESADQQMLNTVVERAKEQGLISHHYWMEDGRFRGLSVPFRYVWPAELDLMARLAGMTLRERWSGWNREPFTSDSRKHISVWQRST